MLSGVLASLSCAQTFEAVPSLTIPTHDVVPRSGVAGELIDDFSLTVRTNVLSHFVKRQTVESNDVTTQVMEANVRGVQTTTTSVQLTSVESRGTARLHVVSTGVVSSNTVGLTPQARVATLGNHTFRVTKPVFFDGKKLLTKPAYGNLQARQFPQVVNSVVSGMPLLGRLSDQIARNEVMRRMPTSDAIVVRQVADDVLRKINTQVDRHLAELNGKWTNLRRTIAEVSADQRISWAASTTENSFSLSASGPLTTQRAASSGVILTTDLQDEEAIAVTISQDSTNHWLNKQALGGLTISDTALHQAVLTFQNVKKDSQAVLQSLLSSAGSSVEPLIFSLKLAESEPVSLAFENGLLTLKVRFQVVAKLTPPSQMHQMKIVLRGQGGADGHWAIALQKIAVEPVDSSAAPDTWTKLIGDQATKIVAGISPLQIPRTLDLRHMDKRIPAFRIHRIQCEGRQLRLSFNLDRAAEKITTRRFVR